MKSILKFCQSIRFRLALVFVLLMVIALEVLGAFFVRQLDKQNRDAFEQQLKLPDYSTNQLETALQNPDTRAGNRTIQGVISSLSNAQVEDIQVVDRTGIIRGTISVSGQQSIGQKTTDPRTQSALTSGTASSYLVPSKEYRKEILTTPLFVPNSRSREASGVIVITASLKTVDQSSDDMKRLFVMGGIVALGGSVVMALVLAKTLTRPIERINQQTTAIANGDYSVTNPVYSVDELGQLAASVNELSSRIEESTEAVNSERNRLNSVLTHMADGVLAVNRRGDVTIINQAAAAFVGKTAQTATGMNVIDVLHLKGDKTIRDLVDQNDTFLIDLSKPGQPLVVQAYVSLIKRQSGFISGLVVVLHNITEQQKNEEEQRTFVSNVSHELRTPLTSVRSYADALVDGAMNDPEMSQRFLSVIQDETKRMSRMINDLLELSRLDQGTMDVKLEVISFNSLLNFVLDRFDMIIKNSDDHPKSYRIERQLTQQDVWIEADPDKLTQVLDNIMNNAVKYSPDGGIITARLIKSGQQAVLSISDQGLGIPKADLKNVFDRFFRVDKSRSRAQGGTGLGLAISKEVVERFRGRIWVDSVENQGSTFYITLACVPDDLVLGDDWDA